MDSKSGDRVLTVIGNNIRAERARAGLRQIDVSERAGLAVTHFARIERGEANSSILIYVRIARALGVSMDTLIQGVE